MTYINEKHRARFTLAAKNIAKANYALLSALYLLTADPRLWSCCKHHINNGSEAQPESRDEQGKIHPRQRRISKK